MKIYNKYLLFQNKLLLPYIDIGLRLLEILSYLASVIFIISFVYRYGYELSPEDKELVTHVYRGVWVVFIFDIVLHFLFSYSEVKKRYKKITWILSILMMLTLVPVIFKHPTDGGGVEWFWEALNSSVYRFSLLLIYSLFNLSSWIIGLLGKRTNPSQMLAASFIIIILAGGLLLKLPTATVSGISWIDSIFIATSAVCVTGLSPVDIPATFTFEGMFIILVLIQIGGLGVMTFTSFFALFFMGNSSLYNRVVVRDLVSSDSLGSLLSTLLYVLLFTLVIEGIGAFAIWTSIRGTLGMGLDEEIWVSIFHSISSFCNAGFSTFSDGLGDVRVFHQNTIFIYVSLLVVLGSIGFPILVNFKDVLVNKVRRVVAYLTHTKPPHIYHLYSLNTKIVLVMTMVLIFSGALMMGFLEWEGLLKGLSVPHKITKAFFLAIIPRSAGFGAFDIPSMRFQTTIVFFGLMWIGGAAQSTAGGVKVNTLAVIFLNLKAVLTGSNRIEVFGRELSQKSIGRAHAIVVVSILMLLISFFLLSIFEPNKDPLLLMYECIAAMSTCGVGLGITSELGIPAKILLAVLMFVGRVGLITFLMGAFKQNKKLKYHYPEGDIIIN